MIHRFFLAAVVAALFTAPITAQATTVSQNLAITITAATPPGFYVATNGSDSNAGTLGAPFATLGKCQTAMQGSSTKICYIRAGTYQPAKAASADGWQCNHHYSNGVMAGAAVFLQSADNGETWSYYPPDGVGTAIIDGQSTVGEAGSQETPDTGIVGGPANGLGCIFSANGASGVTINGLRMTRAVWSGIFGNNFPSATLINNTIDNITGTVYDSGAISIVNGTNATVKNNYIHDTQYHGIFASNQNSADITGWDVENNVVINSCLWPPSGGANPSGQTGNDCGGIYSVEQNFPSTSTGKKVINNYVRDVNAPSNNGSPASSSSIGIYFDDASGHATVSGNVVAGKMVACFLIHGGNNIAITHNICDVDNTVTQWITYVAGSGFSAGMANNTYQGNINVIGTSGSGHGYRDAGGVTTAVSNTNNLYHNYVGGSMTTTSNGTGSDANPVTGDPLLTCWSPVLDPSSPARNSPVSFPGLTGGWGPPGFVMPQTGTAPSWPHTC